MKKSCALVEEKIQAARNQNLNEEKILEVA